MKRILIGFLIFVLWLACVVGIAFVLHFTGSRLILFCVLLGLLGAATIAFGLWYHAKVNADPISAADANSPDFLNLSALLRDADRKLKAGSRGARSLASSPIIYILGDDNSAKTQTILQSGLDAELLAGNLYRDNIVAPTELANLWLAGSAVIVEAGGPLLRNPALWLRLVRATQPGRIGSVFSRNPQQPTRAAVLCVSIEHLPGPREQGHNPDQIRALGQRLNERLRELSQTLGISLPVYVLFTKLDTLQHFGEFATRLTQDEIKLPVGTLLAPVEAGSGLYAERAATLISQRLDQLVYTLAEFRLSLLARSTDLLSLAFAYEFPRDLQKRRASLVDFLVEVARPSQLGLNPFLRGFFFSGMRAILEDVAPAAPQQSMQAPPIESGATRIFSPANVAAAYRQPSPAPSRGSRRIPQWVFLPHLFSKLLLNDESALDASRVSTRVHFLKRALLIAASSCILLYLVLLTISFVNNRALEQAVATAAAVPIQPPGPGQLASAADLQTLDQLGSVLLQLDGYRKDGAPIMDRWGLYRGFALYPVACSAYSARFRTLLLSGAQANILTQLRALKSPPPPEADYNATYKPLKAYLITTSNPNRSTREFLAPVLTAAWAGSSPVAADQQKLAQTQFETYASLLPEPGSCMVETGGAPDSGAVAQARDYLNRFGGFQHVYQSILAAASRYPSIRYNDKFPGSVRFIVDPFEVPGAFTKAAFPFMQDAIAHPGQYFNGEEWVVPPVPGATLDTATLPAQLQKQFVADYLAAWRSYLSAARFTGYHDLNEAAAKLETLASNSSPILELFSLISINTGVALPEISSAFQAPQAVVPPTTPADHFVAQSNQPYIQALQGLKGAIQNVTQNPLAANDPTPILQAADLADQAANNLQNAFNPDITGHMDHVSYERLEDPITAIRAAAKHVPGDKAGGDAKAFCAVAGPVLAKFPFSPQATAEATPEEAAQIFTPGQGALAQFYAKISQFVVLQGGQYGPAPSTSLPINPAFLSFFNAAERVSSALFPAGGTQPTLSFSLTEAKAAGVPDATLNIDGQQVTAGQTTSFRWISQPSSKITLTSDQGNAPAMTGVWSVFKLGFLATHPSPNRLEYSFQFQGHTNQVVHFEADGSGAALLDPHFMGRLRCTTAVVKQ